MGRREDMEPPIPGTRDFDRLVGLRTLADRVEAKRAMMGATCDESFEQGAFAHACLYAEVEGSLAVAHAALVRAALVLEGETEGPLERELAALRAENAKLWTALEAAGPAVLEAAGLVAGKRNG